MKLGKRQIAIFVLLGISSSIFYYTNNLIKVGITFSDGIFIGFLLGLVAVSSLSTIFLFLQMLYINLMVRESKEKK